MNQEMYRRRKWLRGENAQWPERLMPVPPDQWPLDLSDKRLAVWRSRDFMVQALRKGHTEWYNSSDTLVGDHRVNTRDLHLLRKIAAVAVRAMENHEAFKRLPANR